MGTLPAVVGLAVIDSLNPSAIAVAVWLALSGRDVARRVGVYVGAIALTYFCAGVLVLTGVAAMGQWVKTDAAYAVQGVVGAAALAYGIAAPARGGRRSLERRPRSPGWVQSSPSA